DPLSAMYNGVAAHAEFVGRNYAEAMRLAREASLERPDFVGAHRVLTAAAAMAGETELPRASPQEPRRAHPAVSPARIAENLLLRPDQREDFLQALRRAGLD